MSAGLGELFIQLAFKGDVSGAKKFRAEIDNVEKSMQQAVKGAGSLKAGILGLVGSLVGAVYAMNRLTTSLMNNNQAWISLTRQTDLAIDSLQGYAGVASILDKSLGMEGAAQGIANLQQRLYELSLTGQGAEGFMWAGIDPRGKNAFQVLEQLRSRIKGLNNNQATFLLKQMGLDPRMLAMLRMEREEFEKLNAEIQKYTLKDTQRQAIQKYSQQMELARKKMQFFKDTIALKMLPILVKLADALTKVAEAFHIILMSDHPLAMLAKTITLITAAVIGLGVAIWAITAHPIVALITLIIGSLMVTLVMLGLIIEDIIAWTQGKDSVTGYLLGAIDQIISEDRVPKWIQMLWDIISHADKLGNIIDRVKQAKADVDNNPIMKSTNFINKLNPATGSLMGALQWSVNGIVPKMITNYITQNNDITTSETGEAALQGLKGVVIMTGAGN